MDRKIEDAIKLIKALGDEGTPIYIQFSGGKDSLTVAMLTKEANAPAQLLYMESGIDLPGSIEYVEQSAGLLNMNLHKTNPVRDYQGDLSYLVRQRGYWPTIQHNWCSGRLKIRPCRRYLRGLHGKDKIYKMTGVRRQESGRRKILYKRSEIIVEDPEHSHAFLVHPILEWTDGDVLAYLHERGLFPNNPLYNQVGVSGCYWCPFYQDSLLERIARAFPGIYGPIIELENEIGKPSLSGHKFLKHLVYRVESQLILL